MFGLLNLNSDILQGKAEKRPRSSNPLAARSHSHRLTIFRRWTGLHTKLLAACGGGPKTELERKGGGRNNCHRLLAPRIDERKDQR